MTNLLRRSTASKALVKPLNAICGYDPGATRFDGYNVRFRAIFWEGGYWRAGPGRLSSGLRGLASLAPSDLRRGGQGRGSREGPWGALEGTRYPEVCSVIVVASAQL